MRPDDTTCPPSIPDYELVRLIGRGSYGDVWLARGVTGVFRAIKFVWRDRFADLRPYEREFEGITRFAAVSLREPSQLALLHVGRDEAARFFYYVMELADDTARGRDLDPDSYTPLTLKEHAAARHPLPPGEVVELGVTLARAVGSLHAAGLVHRDIKPSNIIFVGGVPKLADVGLVAAASAELTFVGTEGFVPPEGPGAPAADVFSLGKVLYELATGLDRQDWPRLPADLAERADRAALLELNEVLLRACEANPVARFADAGALLDELLLLQAGKSVRKLRTAERRLTRALRIAAGLALVAAVAGTGAYLERRRANEETARRAAAEAERDALARRVVYANTVGNAQLAIRQGEFGKARQLLDELVPRPGDDDLRGFEWHVLRPVAEGDRATILRHGGSAVQQLAQTNDGRLLAARLADDTVAIYNTTNRALVRTIPAVSSLAGFSPDGGRLLGTGTGGRPQSWRLADGDTDGPAATRPHQRVLGLQPDGRMVSFNDGNPAELLIWDFVRREESRRIGFESVPDGLRWDYFRGAVSRDGLSVALAWVRGRSSGADYRLTLVELDGPEPRVHHTEIAGRPSAVGFDARGAWATEADSGALWRCPGAGGDWQPSGEKLFRDIRELQPAGDGRRVAMDRESLYWLDDAGRVIRRGRGHHGLLSDLLVCAGSGEIASGSSGGELRLWPAAEISASKPDHRRIWNSRGGATRVVFSKDSRRLFVPADGQTVAILDRDTLQPLAEVPGLRFPVWVSDTHAVGLAAEGAGYALADMARQERRRGLADAAKPIQMLVSEAGDRFCLNDSFGRLWWEEAGRPATGPVVTQGFENRFALGADRRLDRLWTSGNDHTLRSLSLPDGRERWAVKLTSLNPAIRLSPDGQLLAIPLESGRLELRRPDDGSLAQVTTIGGSTPQDVLFAPDGRRLFVAGSKGDIACFETQTWSQVCALQLPTEEALHYLAMSPDGTQLAAVTKTGALHLLRAR